MAITFEEITVTNRFDSLYTKTANAILNGIADYLDIRSSVNVSDLSYIITANLAQNYPNPFNPATIISYSIPNQIYVSLKVFDGLGREVDILVNKVKSPGNYKVDFDASQLASGIYFYRIIAGDFVQTRKMLLLK